MKAGEWIGKLVRMAKRNWLFSNRLYSDERGLSTIVVTLVLIAVGVVLAFAAASFGAGFLPKGKTPVAQIAFEDYPGSIANGKAFIIKDLGGDAIPLDAAKLVIYNATSHTVVYNSIINDDTGNFTLTNTGVYGATGQALDPGENIIVNGTVINNQPGTYTIQLVYEPTKQTIAEDTITIE